MTERPFNVRIALHGGGRPFVWTNVFADHPYRAAMSAFAEDFWPERWEDIDGEPYRMTVTVEEVLPEQAG